MQTVLGVVLSASERDLLERAVLSGRSVAESAAHHEVVRLGVSQDKPPAYLHEEERVLRRELRAKARQLGDRLDGDALPLLTAEIAYEQWHRLLFAKFLEANDLLIYPGMGVALSLAECAELAPELGEADGWSVAARFASETLPGVFRLTDPCVRVGFAPEDRQKLEQVITGLPENVYRCEDALGWVYQFWQTKRKEQVNKAGNKVGGADISPVTQLFTENYMVRFLLENSLGAWWAGRNPDSSLLSGWEYLRRGEDGVPAAGLYESWPATAAEVTVMDPCCGSGHFLVAAFGMLWRMRAEQESLSPAQAQDAVLRENLFGLELDPRCTQLATFNLVLEAWKQGGYREVPAPNVACSGVPVRAATSEWADLAGDDEALRGSLVRLHSQFRNADTLGSLINPAAGSDPGVLLSATGSVVSDDWEKVRAALKAAVAVEEATDSVLGDVVNDVARAAYFLSRHYTLVATNPPFLGGAKQSDLLKNYLYNNYPESSRELAYVVFDRIRQLTDSWVLVLPQGWTSQKTFTDWRKKVLFETEISLMVRLGSGAFSSVKGQVVNVMLLTGGKGGEEHAGTMRILDAADKKGEQKSLQMRSADLRSISLDEVRKNPLGVLSFGSESATPRLSSYVDSHQGISTSDGHRFVRKFWELPVVADGWHKYQSAPEVTSLVAGQTDIIFWQDGYGEITEVCQGGATFRGQAAWGRQGFIVSQMLPVRVTLYDGHKFDGSGVVFIPKDLSNRAPLWHFLSSSLYNEAIRTIDTKPRVANATLTGVPCNMDDFMLESELPETVSSNDPTQWSFTGDIVAPMEPLQVAVGRLLGYAWPEQVDDGLGALADGDGIVCIPPVAGERGAAERLLDVLAAAYGDEWSPGLRDSLLAGAGGQPGKVESWLRDKFFAHQVKVFQNRPFIWQVWDGRKDGFSALLNYHRLTRGTLEKLIYTVLGAWISRQREDVSGGVTGAEDRLRAAEVLQKKLELILVGQSPYDIYVRWKDLESQPVGWEPDLDDGVRLNIRPFVSAGVLRSKVGVKWEKDRGKNVDGSDRINDVHLTLEEKQAARG